MAIISTEMAMPVAKSVSAIAQVSRLSLCTMAMAIRAISPCSRIAAHLTELPDDWLITIR